MPETLEVSPSTTGTNMDHIKQLQLPKKVTAPNPEPEAKELTDEEKATAEKTSDAVSAKKFAKMPWKKKEDKPPVNETDEQKKERETREKSSAEAAKVEKEKKAREKLKPEEKAKLESDEKAEKEKLAKEKKEKEEKRALKPKAEKPPKPEVDLQKLVSSTVAATAKAMQKEAPNPSEADDVPESRKKEWLAIQKAEESKATHKGASETAKKVFKAEQAYIEEWKKENPGKKFNAKSNEHDAWYDENMPEWVEEAAASGEQISTNSELEKQIEERLSKKYEPLNEKLSQLEMRDAQRSVERVVESASNHGIATAIHALNPELLKEGVNISESDPLAHDILMRVGPEITAQTNAAMMLFATNGKSAGDFDQFKGKVEAAAIEIQEQILKASAEDQTTPDGKTFVSYSDWLNMKSEDRYGHWTITGDLVAAKLANETAQKAKESYDSENAKLEKLAISRGYVKNGTTHTSKEEKPDPAEEEADNNEKPRSPSTAAQTAIKPGAVGKPNSGDNWADRLAARKFGR